MDKALFEAVDNYTSALFAEEDDALVITQRSLHQTSMPHASVSPNQGKLLHILAQLCNARRILEIGTLAGYSTIWMARSLPEEGRLITLESDQNNANIAQRNIKQAGLESKVDIRVGKALELLPQIKAEGADPFDMVFIDADKPPYTEYFQWAVRMSRPGALIVADNVIRDGKVLDKNSSDEKVIGVQRFNSMLAADSAVTAVILQMVGVKDYDGMALAVVNPR